MMGTEVEFTGDWALQAPEQARASVTVDLGGMIFKLVRVVNGDQGWMKQNDNDAQSMPDEALAEEKRQLIAQWALSLVPLKSAAFELTALGDSKVDDRPTAGVAATAKQGREIKLYFDKDSGLLLKTASKVKDMMSGDDVSQDVFYSDYKEVDGIKRAMKTKILRDGKKFLEMETSDFKPVEKLEDKVFAKP